MGLLCFFGVLYFHIYKGLFFFSYRLATVWLRGFTMFVGFIGVAFLGYTLVMGQISFWAAVVITSLLTVVPFFGSILVFWLWGGFVVGGKTLRFFFVLHFLLPFVLSVVVIRHLLFLHTSGRTNPLFLHNGWGCTPFYSCYWWKDSLNFIVLFSFIIFFCLFPFILGDPEGFVPANSISSPVHILPEWYLLSFYGILRAIPNKTLGVIALLCSLGVFFLLPFCSRYTSPCVTLNKILVSSLLIAHIFLRWLGASLVESPFVILSLLFSFFFFFLFLLIIFMNWGFYLLYKHTN